MKFKMNNDSWFGHLALCIVLRHCVAVFRRDEWLWDIQRSSYLYKIWRGKGVWLPIKGTLTSLFSLNKQVNETLSRIHRRSIQLHVLWHDSSSITERVHLYYTLWSDVPSTRGYCLQGRVKKKSQPWTSVSRGWEGRCNGARMAFVWHLMRHVDGVAVHQMLVDHQQ